MISRSDVVVAVARLAVVVAVSTLAVAWWTRSVVPIGALESPVETALAYVPNGAQAVAYANVPTVMASPYAPYIRALRDAFPDLNELTSRAGIDLNTAVDDLLVIDPHGEGGPVLLERGRFDTSRLEDLMQNRPARLAAYRGATMLAVPGANTDSVLAIPQPGVLLFGGDSAVREVLDTSLGSSSGLVGDLEFMRLAEAVGDSPVWSVATLESIAERAAASADVGSRLPPVRWVAFSGRLMPDTAEVRAEAQDATAAEGLRGIAQGFLALAKVQASRNRNLRGILDSVSLGGEGTAVSLTFPITPGLVALLESRGAWRILLPTGPAELGTTGAY